MKNFFLQHFKKTLTNIFIPFLVFLFFLLLWHFVSSKNYIHSFILPNPFSVLQSLVNDFSLLFSNALITFSITLTGIVLSIILSLSFAIIMYYIPLLQKIFYPILLIFQIVPILIFAPLLVIIFGYGFTTQLFIVTLMCFFPILITLLRGFKEVPKKQITLLQSMKANKYQIFCYLIFPKALFSMCSGLRLTITYAISAAIISEWVGSIRGLGVVMLTSQKSFLIERVFAVNIVIIFLSLILYLGAVTIEYKIMPWRRHIK